MDNEYMSYAFLMFYNNLFLLYVVNMTLSFYGFVLCVMMLLDDIKVECIKLNMPTKGLRIPREKDSWSAHHHLVCTKTQEKGAVTPQETEPDLPVSVWQSLAEVRVNSGVPRGQSMTTTVLGLTVCWHKSF